MSERMARHHQSMSRAPLLRLKNKLDARIRDGSSHRLGLMANDRENVFRGNYFFGGGNDVRQDRLAADLMQNFRMFGFQPRPFARRHYGDRGSRWMILKRISPVPSLGHD